jgi:hypothetical protein
MMNAPGARENACTRGVVYTLVDFTLTNESTNGTRSRSKYRDKDTQQTSQPQTGPDRIRFAGTNPEPSAFGQPRKSADESGQIHRADSFGAETEKEEGKKDGFAFWVWVWYNLKNIKTRRGAAA